MKDIVRDSFEREEDDNELYEEEAVVAVSDVHGYLGEDKVENGAYQLLDNAARADCIEEDELISREETDDGYSYSLEAEDTTIVFNGDMIDRGLESQEALDMVFDLLDDAEEQGRPEAVQYLLGNHESFLALPDQRRKDWLDYNRDSQWWHFADEEDYEDGQSYRKEFLDRMAEGQIKAVYEGFDRSYIHAGSNRDVDAENLNKEVIEIGKRLKQAYERSQEDFREEQKKIFFDPKEYSTILETDDEDGRGPKAGILWMDFEHMGEDAPEQVVGHTRGYAGQIKGGALNINSIREYQTEGEQMLVSVEKDGELYKVFYDPERDRVNEEQILGGDESELNVEVINQEDEEIVVPVSGYDDREFEPKEEESQEPRTGDDGEVTEPQDNKNADATSSEEKKDDETGFNQAIAEGMDDRPTDTVDDSTANTDTEKDSHEQPATLFPEDDEEQESRGMLSRMGGRVKGLIPNYDRGTHEQEQEKEAQTLEDDYRDIDFYDNQQSSPVKPWEQEE